MQIPHGSNVQLTDESKRGKRLLILILGVISIAVGSGLTLRAAVPDATTNDRAFLLRSPHSVALLDSARRHLFAYRMDRAERLLYELEERDDGRPAAWFHLTSAALHRALMSDEDRHFETFRARRDTLLGVLDSRPPSLWVDYMRAEAGLWEAVALSKRGRYVRGALVARPAYRRFSRIVEAAPDFHEASKGYGLLHLAIGSMPSAYRFVLGIFGYGGTIAEGLEALTLAHHSSSYNREEAGSYLAFASTMLLQSEAEGLRIMEEIYRSDTTSTLFAHLYGFVLISNRRTDAATDVLRDAVSRSETPDYFYNHYLDFYLAEALFRGDRFAEAERYYRRYLNRHPGPALKALAHLGLGQSLEMQGKRTEAIGYYEQVQAARDFDTDAVSRRAAERLLEEPIAGVDSLLLLGRNAYDSGRYARAEALLTDVLDQPSSSEDQKAEAAYRMGRAYDAQGLDAEAIGQYGGAIAYQSDPAARWAPWSWFYIGKIWLAQELHGQAKQAFKRARSYGGKFDYYQALDQSIRAAKELHDLE